MQTDTEAISEIENLGIEKVRKGQLLEAADLFRQAIKMGSTNFRSRFLLTRILMEAERGHFADELFILEYSDCKEKKEETHVQ